MVPTLEKRRQEDQGPSQLHSELGVSLGYLVSRSKTKEKETYGEIFGIT